MAGPAPLSELILSSTHSASPLPTISLHNPVSGASVYSFRSPVASTSTSTALSTTRGAGKGQDEPQASLGNRRTFATVEGGRGVGGVLLGLGGKDGRAGVNVWNFTRETTQHRLIPPVRLSTMTVSKDGVHMAGGTPDGRLFLWEISTGHLVVTVDAHYRAVSALAFSDDGAALVSGSEDATVSVWSIGRLLNSTPMNPPTPFATLSDHTLPITDLCVGVGAFPKCRIMTSSLDSTVKVWDISTSPPALLSTFSFPTPISHVAWDPLERFFFAAGPLFSSASSSSAAGPSGSTAATAWNGSRVVRVNLYRKKKDEFGIEAVEQVGGLGRGEVERVGQNLGEGEVYEIPDTITALALSPHSPTLLLGTSVTTIHILSLPSLLASRIIPAPPSSTSPGAITFLATLLRPPELGSSAATSAGALAVAERMVMPQGMGRTVLGPSERERGGKNGRLIEMRIGASGSALDLDALISPATGLSSFPNAGALFGGRGGAASGAAGGASGGGAGAAAQGALDKERRRAQELEKEVELLKRQLGRANAVNEGMWKKVVEGTLGGASA
ncbi:hypothetical protein JCM8547_001394 [Rhodosporidiobolus lusitaniae]